MQHLSLLDSSLSASPKALPQEEEWEHVRSYKTDDDSMSGGSRSPVTNSLDGWQRHLDNKTGCFFLYNPKTGKASIVPAQ